MRGVFRFVDTLHTLRSRIADACRNAEREPAEITLIGASKTVTASRLISYFDAGLIDFGENYVQEALSKIRDFEAQDKHPHWHFIGALQSNKAREAVRHFDLIHSVDRPSLARELDKAAGACGKAQRILLQINLGEEAGKAGCPPEKAGDLLQYCAKLTHLRVEGLMSLPPYREEAEAMRPYHRRLRDLRDSLASNSQPLPSLSMGMSNDFEVAIEEGATYIRVGTVLFGGRG